MAKKNQNLESQLKREILEWIAYHPHKGTAWIHYNGGIWDPINNRYLAKRGPFNPKGVFDIEGIWCRRPLYIEVKSPTGKLSAEQEEFMHRVGARGAITIVAYDLRDVVTILSNIE